MRPRDLIAAFPRPAARVRRPTLVVVAGLPASGKSYFARAVAAFVPLAHLASDEVRLALSDGQPTYREGENELVFATIGHLARLLLSEGYHVLIDATGIKPADRAVSLAAAGSRPSVLVWCQVDPAVAAARLAGRAAGADPADRSQANLEIRAGMAGRAVPPSENEARTVLWVEPDHFETAVKSLVRRLGGRVPPEDEPT